MFEGSALLRLATVALLALSGTAASANPPPPDDAESEEGGEKSGGNAVDNAAANPARQAPGAALTPRAYAEMAEFWGLFLTSGNPFLAAYGTPRGDEDLSAPPSLQLQTAPIDGPAESILDDIEDGPILLVGAPGNYYAQPAAQPGADSGATTTPPPESILDFLDGAPPTPPAQAEAAAGPANSAVNQAQRPQAVEKAP